MDYSAVITDDVIEEAKSTFEDFDDDKSGSFEVQLIESALRSFGVNPTKDDIKDIQSDLSISNTVDFNTFLYIIYRIKRRTNILKDIIAAFKLLDKDCTGKIKFEVFERVLSEMFRPLTDKEKDSLFENLDIDNGFVDYKLAASELVKEN